MNSIEGFILAGGRSSRMGTDKARLLLDGQTFVAHIANALDGAGIAPVRLVGNRHAMQDEMEDARRLRVVPDVHVGLGALGGLHAALTASVAEWIFVVACDMPFVTPALCNFLIDRRAGFDAVVPVQADERPQPLCALYRCAACLPFIETMIEANDLRPRALLARVNTRWIMPDEWRVLPCAETFFSNINTPEDYARARRIIERAV